jgi:hypothetical protein
VADNDGFYQPALIPMMDMFRHEIIPVLEAASEKVH